MKNLNLSFKKAFKNHFKLENYTKLLNHILEDYNIMIKEFSLIAKDFIQKLTQLTQNYSKNISSYEDTLKYSDGTLQNIILLLKRIQSIFFMQTSNLQNFLDGYQKGEKNKINGEKFSNLEKISNDLLSKEKKAKKNFDDLDNSMKSLFNSYELMENSLTNIIISKNNKKIPMNEIMKNSDYKKIIEKEKTINKIKEDLTESKNNYFNAHDEYLKETKEISINNINILVSNINLFLSLYNDYYKNSSKGLEHIVENIKENELTYKNILNVSIFDREINIDKYQIKIIAKKYIEDKNKKFQKYEKMGYTIKDDKLFLKDEDIYEVVKIMYSQFEYIDDKNYNLIEEQIKIQVKDLLDKLLSFSIKKPKIFDLNEPVPISDDEINLLYKYMDKSFNRLQFLKILNFFRTKGLYEVPEREFEILKNIFLICADKIKTENDFPCSKLILIISQTFYYIKDEKKIYLQNFIKNHGMFQNLNVWEKYINDLIEEDLNRSLKPYNNDKTLIGFEKMKQIMNNILNAQLLPFCHNMMDFGMDVENIYKIIDPIMIKYQINEDLKQIILDIIKTKQKDNIENNL